MRCGFLACITINAKFTPVSFFRLTTSHDQCCGPKNCSVLLRLLLFLLGLFFLQFQFNKIFFLRLLQCKISLEAVLRQDILVPPFFSASFLEARKFCKCYNICKFSSSLQRKKEVTPYKSFPAARPHEILNNLNCN